MHFMPMINVGEIEQHVDEVCLQYSPVIVNTTWVTFGVTLWREADYRPNDMGRLVFIVYRVSRTFGYILGPLESMNMITQF